MVIDILVGMLLGFLTGLGTGGGSLLMLWLTLVRGASPMLAKTVNLMFFLPCALASVLLNYKKGMLKKALLPIVLGCISAGCSSIVSKNINTEQLKKLFGVLLLILGIKELFYRPRNPR